MNQSRKTSEIIKIKCCEHVHSDTVIYCVQDDCLNRYEQICNECLQQGGSHEGHKNMFKHQFQLKLHSEKEQLIKDLKRARNLNDLQEVVREKFENMRNQIISKLDACASQIFEILNTEISSSFNIKGIDELLDKLMSIKQVKHRNSIRADQQNGDIEVVNKELVYVMKQINIDQIDKVIYKDINKYNEKYSDVMYQIDELQDKLDHFIKQNLNQIISELRLNKNAFPLDEFNYIEKVLQMHKHHVNRLVKISNNYFASASSDSDIIIWNSQKQAPECRIQTYQQITSLEVLNSTNLLCGGPDGNLCIWNWKTKKCIRIIKEAHELSVDTIKRVNNQVVISGGGDQYIKIWNASDGSLIKQINTHTDVINSIDIIDSQKIVCGTSEQNLTIWDAKKGSQIKELAGHFGQIKVVKVISKDFIASGATDNLLKIWKWRDGVEFKSLSGHSSAIYSIEKLGFHEIASGSIDCTVKIWNWYRSQCLKTFVAHRQTVCSILRISNKQFITASDDTTIKIWS